MIATTRMRTVRRIDLADRRVEVEAGVVNLEITRRVRAAGLGYAPDPSSQAACTIGGNIAENSGGPHTLKYGVTANHVLGLEIVLPDGEILTLDRSPGALGYDLGGAFIGSEGTLGIITEAAVTLKTASPENQVFFFSCANINTALKALQLFTATEEPNEIFAVNSTYLRDLLALDGAAKLPAWTVVV